MEGDPIDAIRHEPRLKPQVANAIAEIATKFKDTRLIDDGTMYTTKDIDRLEGALADKIDGMPKGVMVDVKGGSKMNMWMPSVSRLYENDNAVAQEILKGIGEKLAHKGSNVEDFVKPLHEIGSAYSASEYTEDYVRKELQAYEKGDYVAKLKLLDMIDSGISTGIVPLDEKAAMANLNQYLVVPISGDTPTVPLATPKAPQPEGQQQGAQKPSVRHS